MIPKLGEDESGNIRVPVKRCCSLTPFRNPENNFKQHVYKLQPSSQHFINVRLFFFFVLVN
jgi:hypothetical protein